MPEELSWNEWVNQPRGTWLRPLKRPLAIALASLVGLGCGLWLNRSEPRVRLVVATPVAVSINSASTTHDAAFIARLVSDLNGGVPCPTYGCVGTCVANPVLRQDTLRFVYPNGDRLTVRVNSGCGGVIVGIPGPGGETLTHAASSPAVLDDLNRWPTAS
jgi:hypothetical protein